MIKKLVLVAGLLGAFSAFGMHQARRGDKKIAAATIIKKWQDAKPFAGEVVVFQATCGELAPHKYHYTLANSAWQVGYIDRWARNFSANECGYPLYRLYNDTVEIQGVYPLINVQLQEGNIRMRRPTPGERKEILAVLSKKRAEFVGECVIAQRVKALLQAKKS